MIGILLGIVAFAGRLALFLLLELLLQSLNLVSKRLLIGAERLDDVQKLLDRRLDLRRKLTNGSQPLLDRLQYLLDA